MAKTKHNYIRNQLMNRIINGQYPVDSRIPGYHQLADEFNCSYLTVSNAVKSLANEGCVKCQRGLGVFVQPPPTTIPEQTNNQSKIGFIIPNEGHMDIWSNFFSIMIQELDKAEAIAMSVATTEMFDRISSYEIEANFRRYSTYGLDSLIICGIRHFPFRHLKRIEKCFKQLNIVMYNDSEIDFPEANKIIVDFHDIGVKTAERLLNADCKSFLEVTFPLLQEIYATDRGSRLSGHDADILNGVKSYCDENSVEFEKFAKVFRGQPRESNDSIIQRLIEIMKRLPQPIGVFSVGDSRAQNIYQAVERLNWEIGQEIKVIGLYDTLCSTVLQPNLSSFKVNTEAIAKNTLCALHENWKGRTVLCKAELAERDSG